MSSSHMTYDRACFLLDLGEIVSPDRDFIDATTLKKQFHKMALKHHPDKNPHNEYATQHFQEIQDAYHFLQSYTQSPQTSVNNPTTTFKTMMRTWLEEYIHGAGKPQLLIILSKLACMAETSALDYLRNIELDTLLKVSQFASMHQDVFHLSDEFMEQIASLIKEKQANVKVVIVNPTLDDLLSQHLYKMHYGGEVFVIPVWHSVLEYDLSGGGTMMVECHPVLPDNIRIDDHNNLHVDLDVDLGEIWDKPVFSFVLGQAHSFHLYPTTQLYCVGRQTVTLKHCGIPEIHVKRIYDTSVLKHIYVNVQIISKSC